MKNVSMLSTKSPSTPEEPQARNNYRSIPQRSSEDQIPATIIGLESIDRIIFGLCPEIREIGIDKIQCLSGLIKTYFFGDQYILRLIEDFTNEDTIDFIEGISNLIKEQQISNIQELQAHFDTYIRDFDINKICK